MWLLCLRRRTSLGSDRRTVQRRQSGRIESLWQVRHQSQTHAPVAQRTQARRELSEEGGDGTIPSKILPERNGDFAGSWAWMGLGQRLVELPSLSVVWINFEGTGHSLAGFLPAGLACQRCRKIDPCGGVRGGSANRGPEASLRLRRIATADCEIAFLVLGFGEVGIQLNGPIQFRRFSCSVLQLLQRLGQLVVEQ